MRLLPEDDFDDQPLVAGSRLLVADARLDNREELIASLGLSGDWARRAADVAILSAALDRWGDEAVDHLIGDYAFALWDSKQKRLLLARDPFGQRSLYFHQGHGFFAFASMPCGLHALAEVPYAPDLERLAHLVALVPFPGNRNFFQGIERVEAGHLAIVTPGGLTTRRHWNPERRDLQLKRPADYAEALCDVLDRAVESQLRGTGDVAAQMSSGLDSTSVAVTAARLQAERGRRVIACTAAPRDGYPASAGAHKGRITDESVNAAAAAALYSNLDHIVVRGNGASTIDELERGFLLYEKPLFNPCNAVWQHAINDAVEARGIRVLLMGTMGNATISYAGRELFPEAFARGRLRLWWREASALVAHGYGSWPGVFRGTLTPWLPDRCVALLQRLQAGSDALPLSAAAVPASQIARFAPLRRANARLPADSWIHRVKWLRKSDPGNEN
jgi:asparagine synthase (glutamine-hydrolysing)